MPLRHPRGPRGSWINRPLLPDEPPPNCSREAILARAEHAQLLAESDALRARVDSCPQCQGLPMCRACCAIEQRAHVLDGEAERRIDVLIKLEGACVACRRVADTEGNPHRLCWQCKHAHCEKCARKLEGYEQRRVLYPGLCLDCEPRLWADEDPGDGVDYDFLRKSELEDG